MLDATFTLTHVVVLDDFHLGDATLRENPLHLLQARKANVSVVESELVLVVAVATSLAARLGLLNRRKNRGSAAISQRPFNRYAASRRQWGLKGHMPAMCGGLPDSLWRARSFHPESTQLTRVGHGVASTTVPDGHLHSVSRTHSTEYVVVPWYTSREKRHCLARGSLRASLDVTSDGKEAQKGLGRREIHPTLTTLRPRARAIEASEIEARENEA